MILNCNDEDVLRYQRCLGPIETEPVHEQSAAAREYKAGDEVFLTLACDKEVVHLEGLSRVKVEERAVDIGSV